MDEEQAREIEAEITRGEESGDPAEEETAAERQQEVEERDWGAMTARIDALEQQVQGLAAAMATIRLLLRTRTVSRTLICLMTNTARQSIWTTRIWPECSVFKE